MELGEGGSPGGRGGGLSAPGGVGSWFGAEGRSLGLLALLVVAVAAPGPPIRKG